MNKHTPGSWAVCSDDAEKVGKDGYGIAVMSGRLRHPPEREANAALIAAAPDLLAALDRLLDAMIWQGDGNPFHGTATHSALIPGKVAHTLVEACRAAIAKAKGMPCN